MADAHQGSGLVANQNFWGCAGTNYTGTFSVTTSSFRVGTKIANIVRMPDGTTYGTDSAQHSIFKVVNGVGQKIAGFTQYVPSFNNPAQAVNAACSEMFGAACGDPVVRQVLSCEEVRPVACPPRPLPCRQPPNIFISSEGRYGTPDFAGDEAANALSQDFGIGLNTPMGLAVSPDGGLVVADWGNNRIRKINFTTNTISTIAGNGQNLDFPAAGGIATDMPVFGPRGLAFDNAGNLFISTEKGLILILRTDGRLEKVAGLPLEMGGVYANSGHASMMSFSKPYGMAFDNLTNGLFIADQGYNRVMYVNLDTGAADSIAGNGTCDINNPGDHLPAMASNICGPTQVAIDPARNLVIIDAGHNTVRKVVFNRASDTSLSFAALAADGSSLTRKVDGTWIREYRSGVKATYDAAGKQVSSTSLSGMTTSMNYDSEGRITEIILPSGQRTSYYYSGGLLRRIVDPALRETTFEFSGDQLRLARFPDGTSRSFEYNGEDLLSREISQKGLATTYRYTPQLRFESATLPDNSSVAAVDYVTRSLGDDTGQVSTAGYGLEGEQNRSTAIDAKGNTTDVVFDLNGAVSRIKDALGFTTTLKSSASGMLNEVVYPSGLTVQFSYDPSTRDLVKAEEVVSSTEKRTVFVRMFDKYGNLLSETDARGVKQIREYNNQGQLIRQEVQGGVGRTDFTYDGNGFIRTRTIYPKASLAQTTTYERDESGNITRTYLSDGTSISSLYDAAGNVISRTQLGLSGVSTTASYEYDAFNRITKSVTGKNEVTNFGYSAAGELVSVTDPKSKVTSYEYDSRSRVVKKTDAFGSVTAFGYDPNGNVTSQKDPNGNIQTISYDALNRMVSTDLVDDRYVYEYELSSRDQFKKIKNKSSEVSFVRDPRGWIQTETVKGLGDLAGYPTVTFEHSQYENGITSQVASAYGVIQYGLDSANRVNSVSAATGQNFGLSWDLSNRLEQVSRSIAGGTVVSQSAISYTPAGTIEGIQHISGASITSFVGYAYDGRNTPTERRSPSGTTTFAYDQNEQVTSASGATNEVFSYDSLGNRISDSGGSFEYDLSGQRLVEDYRFKYQYDLNGNLTHKVPKTAGEKAYKYSYSANNQLVSISVYPSYLGQVEKQISFQYDALGRRLEKRLVDFANGSNSKVRRYIYTDEDVLAELDGQNQVLARFAHSSLRADDVLGVEITSNGVLAGLADRVGRFYFLKDSMGSITDVADSSGSLVQRYEYSTFGKLLRVSNEEGVDVTSNPVIKTSYAFAGRELDSESGLYFNRARYYDPSLGRFMQQDPHPGARTNPITVNNKYVYSGNSPVSQRDPSGMIFGIDDITFIVIAVVIGGFANDYDKGGGNFFENFANGAFHGLVVGLAIWGVYYAVNMIVTAGIEYSASPGLFAEWGFSKSAMHLVSVGFSYTSTAGGIAGGAVALSMAPGLYANQGNYNGRLDVDPFWRSYAYYGHYLSYITVAGGMKGWVPVYGP